MTGLTQRSWRLPALRRPLALGCVLMLAALWPGQAAAGERDACDAAAPLRTVNLNPFHLVYGIPGSSGACVLPPGASELIASIDCWRSFKSADM